MNCLSEILGGASDSMAAHSWADVRPDEQSRQGHQVDANVARHVRAMLNVTVDPAVVPLFSDILLTPMSAPPIIDTSRPARPHNADFTRDSLHPSLQRDLAPYWQHGISLAAVGGAMNRLYNTINSNEFGSVVPIAIVDGYAVYHGRAIDASLKAYRLRKQLESVLKELRRAGRTVPNVLLLHMLDALPPGPFFNPPMVNLHVPPELRGRPDVAPLVPVLAIAASRSGRTPSAIRVPNMYFGNIHEWDSQLNFLQSSCRANYPFANRTKQAVWRGDSFVLSSNLFHHPRNQALVLQAEAEAENLTNIRFFGKEGQREHAHVTIRRWQSHGLLPDEVADRMVATQCGPDTFIPHRDLCAFRYQLNLPGSISGSYSRNLQTSLPMGSTMLHWDNDAVEWYYERLVDHEHYLVVTRDTLLPTIRALNEDPARARAIAQAGVKLAVSELSSAALVDFYEQLFHALGALQRFDVDAAIILDDACAMHGNADGEPLHGKVPTCKPSTHKPK